MLREVFVLIRLQGLYYSYFKTIVTSPSFAEGMAFLLHDNRTEFPNTINTLQRFNLYPEVRNKFCKVKILLIYSNIYFKTVYSSHIL